MTRHAEILDLLGDECARHILEAGCDDGVTVEELTDEFDVSESTIYRRLRTLEDLELVRSETDIRSRSGNRSIYTTCVDEIGVAVDGDGFDLAVDPNQDGDRLLELLQELEFDRADVDFDAGTVDLRVHLDPQVVDAFLELWERIDGADGE